MKNLKHLRKRGLAMFLALVMCLSLVQVTAFAEDDLEITSDPCACGVEGCTCAPETCSADSCTAPCDACAAKQQADKEAAEKAAAEEQARLEAEAKAQQEAAERAAALAAELQTMIDNLPAPETVIPEDQTVYNQIAAVYSFAEANGLLLTEAQETAVSLVSQALNPMSVIPEEPEMVLSGSCGATEADNVTWNLEPQADGTYTLQITGTGAMKDFENPTDKNSTVRAPWYSSLTASEAGLYPITNIVIGEGVTRIGDFAFALLAISEITFSPNVTEYGTYIYRNCSNVTTVNWDGFSSTVTSVPEGLFYGCKNLSNFRLGSTSTSNGEVLLPDTIREIGTNAFNGCSSLTKADLTSVEKLGKGTFRGCEKLSMIVLPKIVSNPTEYFDTGCFWGTAITSIELPHNLERIPATLFYSCSLLTKVEIPDSVKVIGRQAFYNCSSLSDVKFGPNSVLEFIGKEDDQAAQDSWSFASTSLTEFTMPDSVNEIKGKYAFQNNKQLKKIVLSNNLKEIPTSTFEGCDSLEEIVINVNDSKLETLADNALKGSKIKKIAFPATMKKFGGSSLYNCNDLTAIDLTKVPSEGVMFGNAWCYYSSQNGSLRAIYVADSAMYGALKKAQNGYFPEKTIIAITDGGFFPAGGSFENSQLGTPVKEGYTFDGWYKYTEGSTDSAEKASSYEAKGVYIAKWAQLSETSSMEPLAFGNIQYGAAIEAKTVSVTDATFAYSSNENVFAVTVSDNIVTVTPKENLSAGKYDETIFIVTKDDAVHSVKATLEIQQIDSAVKPDEKTSQISAQYGEVISLTAEVEKASAPSVRKMSRMARTAMLQDKVDFYCGDTLLGSAYVDYGVQSERIKGTATLKYSTTEKGIPIGQSTIKAIYGGSVNLNGSDTDSITVTLTPKPLTVTGLTAVGRQENGSNVVAIGGTAVLDGIIANDTVVPVASAFGTMADPASGSGKAVTVPVSLGGTHSVWYTVSPVTLTVNISAAPVVDNPIVFPSFTPTYPTGGGTGNGGTTNPPTTITDPDTPLDDGTTITDEETPLVRNPLLFRDVPEDMWCRDAVAYVFDKGLMKGISDTIFAPAMSTERGMIVTILHRLEGEPTAAASSFTDVTAGKWYTDAIAWGAANGVVEGYSDTIFKPTQDITREQLAAILFRYAQLKGYDTSKRADLSAYTDAGEISAYALEAMRWAVAEELISGVTSYTLVPGGRADRAQVATILMRFCENIVPA